MKISSLCTVWYLGPGPYSAFIVTQRVSISQEVNPFMVQTNTSYNIYRKLKYPFMVCGSPIQKDDTKERP